MTPARKIADVLLKMHVADPSLVIVALDTHRRLAQQEGDLTFAQDLAIEIARVERMLKEIPDAASKSEQPLTKINALRAYARMMHHLSDEYLEPLLADDVHYASQWVFEEITNKQQFLTYIRSKLEAIRQSGQRVWAEVAELQCYPGGPCLVLAQDHRNNVSATLLVEVAGGKIKRLDMCFIPPPDAARRTGEYPE